MTGLESLGRSSVRLFVAATALLFVWAGPAVARADITVDAWTLATEASVVEPEGGSVVDEQVHFTPAMPFVFSHTATATWGVLTSTATTTYDFSSSTDAAAFLFTFAHNPADPAGSGGASRGSIFFTPDANITSYALGGDYALTGTGLIHLGVSLRSIDGGEVTLFNNIQESEFTTDQTLTVGGQDGLDANQLEGSLAGSLDPGTTYVLSYEFFIVGGDDDALSAAGALSLILAGDTCGNGTVDPGEECDDGNESNNDDCLNTCENAGCGDGYLWNEGTGTEECDDGPANSDSEPDACRTDCVLAHCCDGVVDTGEECDTGPAKSDTQPDACRLDCRIPYCGDGVIDTGEECDDGNVQPGDGCNATCHTEQEPIPTASEWGLVVMALLLLTGLKIAFGRRGEARQA